MRIMKENKTPLKKSMRKSNGKFFFKLEVISQSSKK